jgi:hypothetical protein
MKQYQFLLLTIIAILSLSVIPLFGEQLYDLCYFGEPLKDGKFLFVRYRNPLLDPVLRTFETYVFDPASGKILFLQQYGEMSYLLPVVSPDRTSVTYHSLIEGNDYLVTRNLITGRSTRLRFDTSGYFLFNDLHYDNETVVSVLKRGPNRQAIYIIYNDLGTIQRLHNGTDFQEVGFLYNGNVYYVDHIGNRLSLGVVQSHGQGRTVVEENVEYVRKTPRGDGILYSIENELFLYRVFNNESIRLTEHFSIEGPLPLIADDGSACVVHDGETTLLINIPSGDVLYYLSFRGDRPEGGSPFRGDRPEGGSPFRGDRPEGGDQGESQWESPFRGDILTRYTYYAPIGSQVYSIKYKKPGQQMEVVFSDEGSIRLLAVSPDDRYLLYRLDDMRELRIFDREKRETFTKTFPFVIERVIVSPFMEFSKAMGSIYLITLSPSGDSEGTLLRELYQYNYRMGRLTSVSTAQDTDIRLYLRER